MPAELVECVNSRALLPVWDELEECLGPVSELDVLQQIRRGNAGSAPGLTGMSYGLIRMFPEQLQKVLWNLVRCVVQSQVCPEGLADLVVLGLPKASAPIGGFAGCRPISLYEIVLKMATGVVQTRLNSVIQRSGLLHQAQFSEGRPVACKRLCTA